MTDDLDHWIHRYFPTGAGLVAGGSFAYMWLDPVVVPRWLAALNALAILFAAAVQLEAIYRRPEEYPEVVGRGG